MMSASAYRIGKPPRKGTLTCDTCKTRHQKCSGAQPRCNNCELRGIGCSYSITTSTSTRRARRIDVSRRSQEPDMQHSADISSRPSISSSDYAILYSQIFDDIVRDLNLHESQGSPNPGAAGEAFFQRDESVPSRLSATLPSFYREVSAIVAEQVNLHEGQTTSELTAKSIPTSQLKALALEGNLEHARKILRDSLPPQERAQRLLDLFFDYQNSIFFVCTIDEARGQLALMYDKPNEVSLSWFCQMFLIFSVALQFDDMDDHAAMYYEVGKKYMDDAVEENPQNTLWVVRAMLLLCFYQPPTKWTTIWMYLGNSNPVRESVLMKAHEEADAAIRGAQRFQLDVGQNQLEELSDEEYQQWRQLWLTIISFDRCVANFLGRLPRIKESISRDPIFKGPPFPQSPEYCTFQSNITTLAIISGNILRDIYFSEGFRLSACRQYKDELNSWAANLSDPLRQNVESGVFLNLPKGQAEATRHLHYMLLGARMLLGRPLLLKAIKSGMSLTRFASPIVSVITADAAVCITYAFQLITSAETMLSMSIPPRSLFMPIFFLINAANIIVLATVWKQNQRRSNTAMPLSTTEASAPNPELVAINTATSILEWCGQRNPFARKYAILVKELRLQLENWISRMPITGEASPLSASRIPSLMSTPHDHLSRSISTGEFSGLTDSAVSTSSTSLGQEVPAMETSGSIDMSMGMDMNTGHVATGSGTSPSSDRDQFRWSEQFGIYDPNGNNNLSLYDSSDLMQDNDEGIDFLNRII